MSATYYQGIFIAEIYSSFLHFIFVETRSASFKPIMHRVKKPISSVLEKIHLHKVEILEKFSGWYVMFPGGYLNELLMILFFWLYTLEQILLLKIVMMMLQNSKVILLGI
jgi:hypothetical protein